MANWSDKEKEDLEESIKKLKALLEPPKKADDASFLKDIFNIKEKNEYCNTRPSS